MTVQQVINLAANGELKQLAVAKDVTSNIETILGYINLGMIELYKRIPLKVNEYLITVVPGQSIYDMPADYMWIVAAYGEVGKDTTKAVNILPINNEDDVRSVNTISWNKVQIPDTEVNGYVSIIYQPSPTIITESDLENEIDLPVQLVEALLHYIGYRGHAAVNGEIQAENSTHYTRFEKSIALAEQRGMFSSDNTDMDNRITSKGFI